MPIGAATCSTNLPRRSTADSGTRCRQSSQITIERYPARQSGRSSALRAALHQTQHAASSRSVATKFSPMPSPSPSLIAGVTNWASDSETPFVARFSG